MGKPYVISAELDLGNADIEKIVKQERIEGFRESLNESLRNVGKETRWIESGAIRGGMQRAITTTSLPVVSLDDRYLTTADAYIGISRGVDTRLNDAGYVARVGYPTLEKQLGRLISLGSEIILADDVLFSGEMMSWLVNTLEERGVKIRGAVCGVAVQTGLETLANRGVDVEATQIFAEVEDEICERDFAVVPGSGRRVKSIEANALYFDSTNGRPSEWASIPSDVAEEFAYSSYVRSADLIKPNLRLEEIGNFYGWGTGNAVATLEEAAILAYSRVTGVAPLF